VERETVILFFALLTVALQITLVVGVVGSAGSRRRFDGLAEAVGPLALGAAALVALTSTLGSLYLSEVANFLPCKLCWYQRIAMYPLSIMLAIAAVRRDGGVRRYAFPLAFIGALISIYHVLLERFPSLESSACDPENPCSLIWVKKFGYVTIPTMALTGFLAIMALLTIHHRWERSHFSAKVDHV
jgi:disulfide bond formation protein DsbB